MYILQNNFFYKNAIISIVYHVAANENSEAKILFGLKKDNFQKLLTKTIFQ
jgi:hypothetical protein